MGRIFCILGKSGSGKDTVYRRLIADSQLKLKGVMPYTTRPLRNGETDGVEYHFINGAELEELQRTGRIIERREYHTVHGIWDYATVDDGQFDLAAGDYLMIATLEGYESLSRYFGRENVVPLYLEVEDGVRLERAMRREKRGGRPDYAEMCRRFLADSRDFSPQRLAVCGIRRFFRNDDLMRCVADIRRFIQDRTGPEKFHFRQQI